MIGFEAGGRRLTTRLIAGEYIKYRSRFPADLGCRADMPAGPFTEAVRRVSLVAERGSAVRLSFGAGQVTIEAETQGRARARETVRAEFEGPEPVIAFSPHFLLDGIIAAGTPAALRLDDPDGGTARETAAQQPGREPVRRCGAAGITAARQRQASPPPVRRARPEPPAGRREAGRRRGRDGSQCRPASAGPASAGSADSGPLGPEPAADALAGTSIRLEFTSPTRPAVITGGPPGQGTTGLPLPGRPPAHGRPSVRARLSGGASPSAPEPGPAQEPPKPASVLRIAVVAVTALGEPGGQHQPDRHHDDQDRHGGVSGREHRLGWFRERWGRPVLP